MFNSTHHYNKVQIKRNPGTPLYEIIKLIKNGYSAEVIYVKITSKEYLYTKEEIQRDLNTLKLIYNIFGKGMSFSVRGSTITFYRKKHYPKFSIGYTKGFKNFYAKHSGYKILIGVKSPRNISTQNYTHFTRDAINYKRYLNDFLGKVYMTIDSDSGQNLLPQYYLIKNICKACGPYGLAFFKCLGKPGDFKSLINKRIPTAVDYWKVLSRMINKYEDFIQYQPID